MLLSAQAPRGMPLVLASFGHESTCEREKLHREHRFPFQSQARCAHWGPARTSCPGCVSKVRKISPEMSTITALRFSSARTPTVQGDESSASSRVNELNLETQSGFLEPSRKFVEGIRRS